MRMFIARAFAVAGLLGAAATSSWAQAPAVAAPAAPATICGVPVPPPANLPPAGSGPVVYQMAPCFQAQGNVSTVDPQTYLYYIQLRPSQPSQNNWIPYDARAEQTMLEDFKRLWATNFLSDLSIEVKENTLSIRGEKQAEVGETTYLHRGIAGRSFERKFQLADHVVVKGARLENGLLHVDLVRELPEAIIVNPYDMDQCAEGLHMALSMPAGEQRARMRLMRGLIREFNVYRWAGRMLIDAAGMRSRRRLFQRSIEPELLLRGSRQFEDLVVSFIHCGLNRFEMKHPAPCQRDRPWSDPEVIQRSSEPKE